jgi:uncharacterized protein (TIGR03435 family)
MTIWSRIGAAALAVFCLEGQPARAQSQPAPMAFEVASVKPAAPGPYGVRGSCHGIDSVYTPTEKAEAPPLGRCVITDGRLSHMVSLAWGIGSMELIKSGPDWIQRGDDRYNVEAKAEDPTKVTEQQLLTMLQALLVERFQMKFHLEPTERPGFALTIAKNGPKLKETKSEDSGLSFGVGGKGTKGDHQINFRRYSMPMLANLLTGFGGHGPAIDKTGLTGLYDFSLMWDDEAGPTLSTALQEQLGLGMRSEKVPVSYLIIDSAQKPGAN